MVEPMDPGFATYAAQLAAKTAALLEESRAAHPEGFEAIEQIAALNARPDTALGPERFTNLAQTARQAAGGSMSLFRSQAGRATAVGTSAAGVVVGAAAAAKTLLGASVAEAFGMAALGAGAAVLGAAAVGYGVGTAIDAGIKALTGQPLGGWIYDSIH